MPGVEHCQNPDQHIVTGWRRTRPPADHFGEHIAEGSRDLQGRSNGLRHPGGFVPGPIRRDCRKDSEPTSQARFDLVVARGSQRAAARQSTIQQALPDPKLTKPALTLTGSPLRNPRASKSADATRMPNGRSALSAARSVHISARIIRFTARANTL